MTNRKKHNKPFAESKVLKNAKKNVDVNLFRHLIQFQIKSIMTMMHGVGCDLMKFMKFIKSRPAKTDFNANNVNRCYGF